jgi:hypothetical protein
MNRPYRVPYSEFCIPKSALNKITRDMLNGQIPIETIPIENGRAEIGFTDKDPRGIDANANIRNN